MLLADAIIGASPLGFGGGVVASEAGRRGPGVGFDGEGGHDGRPPAGVVTPDATEGRSVALVAPVRVRDGGRRESAGGECWGIRRT